MENKKKLAQYTPEQEKEMEGHADEVVNALNDSARSDSN